MMTETDKLIDELEEILREHNPNVEKTETLWNRATKQNSQPKEVSVQSTQSSNTTQTLWNEFVQATIDIDRIKEFYKKVKEPNNRNERDIRIYLDKKYILKGKGYKHDEINEILSFKNDLSKRRINQICDEIDEKMKKR